MDEKMSRAEQLKLKAEATSALWRKTVEDAVASLQAFSKAIESLWDIRPTA